MKNIRSNKAFTLVEVLIVLIIIGVLAGLVYLSAGGADDSAKRAACLSEREKIKSQYAMDQFGTTESFDVRIAALIKEDAPMANGNATSTEAKYTGLCASGGEYTIKPTDIGITVSCNHKGHGATIADSGGGGNNEENVLKIPETPYDLPLPNTYYDYNKQSYINYLKDQQSTSNIPKGTAIYLGKEGEDGTFYVAIGNISVTNGITQGSVFNEGAFIKINSEREGTAPASWTEAKEGETYRYGDVCLYEGEYYVCSMGSTETPGTVTKGNIYNLETNSPKSSPGIWTKIIL